MEIKIKAYYVNEYFDEKIGFVDKNIIFVNDFSAYKHHYETETLWIQKGTVKDIYSNIWSEMFFEREATKDEITLFLEEQEKRKLRRTFQL